MLGSASASGRGSVLEFVDTDTGEVVRVELLPLPPDAKPCYWMFLGPDDVLYLNQVDSGLPEFVAYAPTDAGYRELAGTMHAIGDSTLMRRSTGITLLGGNPPVMAFVGIDGPRRHDHRHRWTRQRPVGNEAGPAR